MENFCFLGRHHWMATWMAKQRQKKRRLLRSFAEYFPRVSLPGWCGEENIVKCGEKTGLFYFDAPQRHGGEEVVDGLGRRTTTEEEMDGNEEWGPMIWISKAGRIQQKDRDRPRKTTHTEVKDAEQQRQ